MSDKEPPATANECLEKKMLYDQCFDVWYRDVFLQNKSQGKLGCQDLYKDYSACIADELQQDGSLVQSIRGEMNSTHAGRWIGKDFPTDAKADNVPKKK
ncbi:hypothetical protein H310_11415 [Aphanomyces invadans]|uniref:Mitochondrial distribution and morphology protein 35 n=1 Tax=Aphanomyces invadans TaxID=157072 RepID=A0A024TMC0_9STRA|nr:hypothetical protein H310_11415 [Aphanomyces invadans]ETV95149.1 hypothetical protein H310_11415 [Aphanomyces invadans]|eukprot:XP_008876322.1 hypothetical protein H310_11415 [Aphanomyces invadans]